MKRVEEFKRRLVELSVDPDGNKSAIEVLTALMGNIQGPLRKQKLLNYTLAGGLYLLLGACVSSMLAQDLFQALAIGAGWTSLIGAAGLKGEFQDLEARREEAGKNLKDLLEPKFRENDWTDIEAEKVRILIKEATI